MDEEIKETGEMATIEGEEEITIEEDYTALEAETIIIDDDSNIQTDAEYEQAVGQKELADEAREALSAVLLSVLEKGEINDDDIAEIAAQQEIYTENVTALKILGLTTEDGKSTGGKSTTNVITSNIDYDELIKVLSEKADWLYIDEDGQVMLNGEVVPKIKVIELEAEKIKADVGEFKDLTTENFTATNATIENLKANKADIEYLNANYATIENLNATNANITNLQANKADIIDLNAANANIANLQAIKANITDLDAAKADINVLNSDVANIQTLVNGNLTSDNIQSMVITGDKFTVANGFIKNAMIDSVSANKINAGIINTNNVSIQSNDGSMLLQGNLQQFKDKNGKVRIQIGKDAKGNFTFCLYDENGTGQLINEKGIQSSNAIADGLIVDAKVAENANIAGSKLDIDSVVTEVNNGSTSIKGTRIYLDGQKQSLDVAFNNMTTTVKGNTDTLNTHTTSINTMDGKVTQLISDTTITKQDGTTTSLKDAYNATVDTVNSHTTKIGSLETNLSTANNNISSVSSKQTALEQNLNGFKQTVSDTYTTKADFNGLDIGGNNILPFSSIVNYELTSFSTDKQNFTVTGTHNAKFDGIVINPAPYMTAGQKGILQFKLKKNSGTLNNIGCHINNKFTFIKGLVDGIERPVVYASSDSWGIDDTNWHHVVVYFTYNGGAPDYPAMCPQPNRMIDTAVNVTYKDIKVEIGNKPSAWSPCIKDIQGDIAAVNGKFVNYSTTSDMNSAINQKANEITSTVSETYATKTSVTDVSNNLKNNYSTTSAMNSAINQKANEITSSVSETYATKTSLKATDDKFTNYSTTSQMNSAINQKANEITSTVSETYATKTALNTVDGKFANYSTTNQMNSAINQKSDSILSTVSNTYATKSALNTVDGKFANYSTTSAMNSAINQKGDSILSTVSSNYTTKADFNGLDIGGNNILPFSSIVNYELTSFSTDKQKFTITGTHTNAYSGIGINPVPYMTAGQKGILQFKLKKNSGTLTNIGCHVDSVISITKALVDGVSRNLQSPGSDSWGIDNTNWHQVIIYFTYKGGTPGDPAICPQPNRGLGTTVNVTYKDIKVEIGNKPSAWSPCIKDIQGDIATVDGKFANYSTTSQMSSAINQKANEITNTVSEVYAKKEDVTAITDNIGDYMINISKSTILLTSDLDGNITN